MIPKTIYTHIQSVHFEHWGVQVVRWCNRGLYRHEVIVRYLLEAQIPANPNVTNCTGETPLHEAAFRGYDVIAHDLLEARIPATQHI